MPTDMFYTIYIRKTRKIKKWKMTKIQNGHHFDVQVPKWQIVLLYSASNTYWFTLVYSKSGKFPKFKMNAIMTYLHQNGQFQYY